MTRRDLGRLLPALVAAQPGGQTAPLSSACYRYEELPVRERGENRQRPVLNGELRSGFAVEMHETELGPGLAPHAPHHHPHEEVLIVREGMLEVTIAGKSARLGPGSVAFMASDQEHGWRNVSDARARYYILALGPDRSYRDNAARDR
jgi:quercetin dioxygenase-like cupin family protein